MPFELPWHKYALIAELSEKVQGADQWFGKTALQKYIYLLQELRGKDVGYDFSLYTYGPFDPALLSDLDITESRKGVQVEYRADVGGYHILPGESVEDVKERGKEYIGELQDDIQALIEDFGDYGARELELASTVIFLQRQMTDGQPPNVDELVARTKRQKSHFDEKTIHEMIVGLIDMDHIEVEQE